jgi:hypothetical protein
VLLSSASSKTAYGTAFLLRRRGREVVGLTSPANVAFASRLGLYDRVVAYDDLSSLPSARPTVYVDLSGSSPLRAAVHRHFDDALRYSCAVGATHWQSLGRAHELPGLQPTPFFTPERVKQRSAQWTAPVLQKRLAEAWSAFLVPVLDPERSWMRIRGGRGPEAVEQAYRAIVAGLALADEGHVLSLNP